MDVAGNAMKNWSDAVWVYNKEAKHTHHGNGFCNRHADNWCRVTEVEERHVRRFLYGVAGTAAIAVLTAAVSALIFVLGWIALLIPPAIVIVVSLVYGVGWGLDSLVSKSRS